MTNGFEREVVALLTEQVTLQKEANKDLGKLAGVVATKEDMERIDTDHREFRTLLYKIAGALTLIMVSLGITAQVVGGG